ncbi:MAG: phosphoadenylyl-sulfate reductase [Armatimonadaceae bacterium]
MSATPTEQELHQLNTRLEGASPQAILQWAAERFGDRLTLACSFGGVSGMALLDMAVKIQLDLKVFYIDTEFLFPETYATRDAAMRKYGVIPLGFRSKLSPEEQAAQWGDRLWERDPDQCCALRKVEPNQRALDGMEAWIAGLRRDQSSTRRTVNAVQWDAKFGLYKICPLYAWTEEDVWDYIAREGVPVNPLHAHGYASIGCTHCTRAIGDGEDLRAGRWSGTMKTECGLHK